MMKNSINKALLLGIICGLSACASTPHEYGFTKEGASEYDKTSALSECNYQIKLGKADKDEQKELLILCMQGKGYRYVRMQ